MYRYIDVHSHVGIDLFGGDSDEVIRSMEEQGIATIVVGVDAQTSERVVACAERYGNVWATVGVHPEDGKSEDFDVSFYRRLAAHEKVVALGECGLDYYRLTPEETVVRKAKQQASFKQQIELAVDVDLPLMLHGRPSKGSMDAYEDMLSVLTEYKEAHGERLRGNAHFFVGNPGIAKRFFELDFTVSFSGVVTFALEYDEVIRAAPGHMIHAETDSPYATPAPHRGKRNDPRHLPLIVKRLAEIRGEDEEMLRETLLSNAKRVFGL